MILKTVTFAAGLAVAAGVGYLILDEVAPSVTSRFDAAVREHVTGWSESACAADPLSCLASRYETLRDLERSLDVSVRSLRLELGRVMAMIEDQQMLVEKNAALLNQGRDLYRSKADDGPIAFAGREYPNKTSLKAQLELLLREKSGLEGSVREARELQGKLKERLDDLLAQGAEVSLAKQMVPAKMELLKANQALAGFKINVAAIDDVIRMSEGGLADSQTLIRTTRQILEGSYGGAREEQENPDLEAFLRSAN